MATRPLYQVPALERGLDVLELLAGEAEGLALGELARRMGRSPGALFRIVSCLQRRGYLEPSAEGHRLGMRLFELAHRHPPLRRLLAEALPLMQGLAAAIGQSCHLVVPNGARCLVVAAVDAPGAMGFRVRPGAELEPETSSSGRVLLAFGPEAPGRGPELPPELRRTLRRIRAHGHDEIPSRDIRGIRNISFPVRDVSGQAVAALTVPHLQRVGAPRSTVEVERAALAECAARLTRSVGG